MNKRIFRSMSLLVFITLLLFAALFGLAASAQMKTQIKEGLKTLRISVIDASGAVVYDNMADPKGMENHLDRPEVSAALQSGAGESERFSDTLDQTTYYYAVRLASGNVLRLALTAQNLLGFLRGALPLMLLCLAFAAGVAFIAARGLTRRVTAPINALDLDAPELDGYDELLPLVKKIEAQKKELKTQLETLENRTATITAITGSMQEGLLLLDRHGKVLLANAGALALLNKTEAVGKNMAEVFRDPAFLKHAKLCLAGKKSMIALSIGGRFYDVFFNPVLHGDALGGAAVLFIDFTERHAAETQRKEFSANVSHELKTPLTTIAALSEMIENGTAKEEDVRPFAKRIELQAKRLIAIISDIIRLSEFDEASAAREFTRFDLYEAAEAVVESLKEKAAEKNVAVAVTGDAGLTLTANARMVDELLYNLVDNAIRYNREGGSVRVALEEKNDTVEIFVSDTGIGIPRAHIDRVFERFYRVDGSRSKKTGGTGLGLSIVKHIAEFHGARVTVKSEEGAGSTFTCVFHKRPR